MAGGVVIIKVVFIILIAIMAFVAGILPGIIPWCKKSTNFLGIANAFTGGVFLAIAFLHILPETTAAFQEFMEEHDEPDKSVDWLRHGDDEEFFPLPFALAFVGYSFILLIDKVIFDTHSLMDDHHGGSHGKPHGHSHGKPHGHQHEPQMISGGRENMEDQQKLLSDTDSWIEWINYSGPIEEDEPYRIPNKFVKWMDHALNPREKFAQHKSGTFSHIDGGLADEQEDMFTDKTKIRLEDEESEEGEKPKKKCGWNLTPVVLMIALSVHAVFEGIATGLIQEPSNLWTYVIAIGLHKWAAAMSLGISMTKNFKEQICTMYVILTIFSWATPLGILIGMLVSSASEIVNIIFSSLAAGTFVYISCSEVIVEEFSTPTYKWVKMVAFLVGAGVIALLGLLE